jgi:hypothetical protein
MKPAVFQLRRMSVNERPATETNKKQEHIVRVKTLFVGCMLMVQLNGTKPME